MRQALWPRRSTLETPLPPKAEEARAFLETLRTSSVLARSGVAVIVFELLPAGVGSRGFGTELTRLGSAAPPRPPHLQVLEVQDLLGEADYFDLDDHLRETGHDKVARELLKALVSAAR